MTWGCLCRWLYVPEDDIKNLPCFQVSATRVPCLRVQVHIGRQPLGVGMILQRSLGSLCHAGPLYKLRFDSGLTSVEDCFSFAE